MPQDGTQSEEKLRGEVARRGGKEWCRGEAEAEGKVEGKVKRRGGKER